MAALKLEQKVTLDVAVCRSKKMYLLLAGSIVNALNLLDGMRLDTIYDAIGILQKAQREAELPYTQQAKTILFMQPKADESRQNKQDTNDVD